MATDKRTSFVGSDFLYEDVSGRNLDADKHELTGTDDNDYIIRVVGYQLKAEQRKWVSDILKMSDTLPA